MHFLPVLIGVCVCEHVRVHVCSCLHLSVCLHLIQASSCPPLLPLPSLAHPQGYGISGHLITASLHAKYIVAVSRTPATVFVCTFHYAFKPLSSRGCTPAVINEHDLGKQKGWRTMIPLLLNSFPPPCSRCVFGRWLAQPRQRLRLIKAYMHVSTVTMCEVLRAIVGSYVWRLSLFDLKGSILPPLCGVIKKKRKREQLPSNCHLVTFSLISSIWFRCVLHKSLLAPSGKKH